MIRFWCDLDHCLDPGIFNRDLHLYTHKQYLSRRALVEVYLLHSFVLIGLRIIYLDLNFNFMT